MLKSVKEIFCETLFGRGNGSTLINSAPKNKKK